RYLPCLVQTKVLGASIGPGANAAGPITRNDRATRPSDMTLFSRVIIDIRSPLLRCDASLHSPYWLILTYVRTFPKDCVTIPDHSRLHTHCAESTPLTRVNTFPRVRFGARQTVPRPALLERAKLVVLAEFCSPIQSLQ